MKFNCVNEAIQPGTLPDGRYEATWHGYEVSWKIGVRSFAANVTDGVRGWSTGFVVIESGQLRFEK